MTDKDGQHTIAVLSKHPAKRNRDKEALANCSLEERVVELDMASDRRVGDYPGRDVNLFIKPA